MSDMGSMKGGKILGQGSYGCVFTPPLVCKGETKARARAVGKITEAEEGLAEVEAANRLRSNPLHKNYFILPDEDYCTPAPFGQQKNTNMKLCSALQNPDENDRLKLEESIQLFEDFGGKRSFYNLKDATNLHPYTFKFYDFMRHMLEAGSILLTSGVCHFDIYPRNILMDENNVGRILDFGMAFLADKLDTQAVDTRWKILKFGGEEGLSAMIANVSPPEYIVMTAINKGISPDSAIQRVIAEKPIFNLVEKYLQVSKSAMYNDMSNFWNTSDTANKKDWVEFWKLYWTGYDAWGIGVLILDLLKKQLAFQEFADGEWQKRQTMVLTALRGLLDISPRTRLDCVEALAIFDPGNIWLQRFGQPWLAKRKALRAKLQSQQ